jgi:hypothetical protein
MQEPRHYVDNDAEDYAQIGISLWRGEGIRLNGMPDVILPPGFPAVVGLFNLFLGDPVWSGKIVCLLSFLLSVFLLFRVSFFFVNQIEFAWAILLLYASNSNSLFSASSGYSESLFTVIFLTMVWLVLIIKNDDRFVISRWMSFTILWALLYYIKPEGLIIGCILFIWLIWFKRISFLKKTWFIPLVFIILIFPYLFFLKEYTGTWQWSGKTYANLVMGELRGTYQRGIDTRTPEDRYSINDKTVVDPSLSKGLVAYWNEKENDIFERIPVNLAHALNFYWFSLSVIGLILAFWGIWVSKKDLVFFLLSLMFPIAVYLIFFISARTLGIYHWIWAIYMVLGLQAVGSLIESRSNIRWAQLSVSLTVFLIALYQMRGAIKLIG